eukprot:TRINITY_DN58614_c0_g1_i1.p2 TRINITY_DN58614_c0_g1~~TRINITY_DN58614_c0_g1_i1.p2  ORF type:complete len:144 (+),score=26.52 TRINITY_DN58614_c0_g1_i1:310-741(+)
MDQAQVLDQQLDLDTDHQLEVMETIQEPQVLLELLPEEPLEVLQELDLHMEPLEPHLQDMATMVVDQALDMEVDLEHKDTLQAVGQESEEDTQLADLEQDILQLVELKEQVLATVVDLHILEIMVHPEQVEQLDLDTTNECDL